MDMPTIQPLSIPTKGQPFLVRLWSYFTYRRQWRFVKDWFFTLPDGTPIIIHPGFVFDGASVPRLFWSILSPTGLLFLPAIVHDHAYGRGFLLALDEQGQAYLYGKEKSRGDWDRLFLDVALMINDYRLLSILAWLIIRLFGWVAWNKHRANDWVVLVGGPNTVVD